MSNHTPGPWNVTPSASHNGFTVWPDRSNPDAAYISVFCSYGGKTEAERKAKTKADADLIAAAPDLLEALKVCATLINIQNGNLHQDVNAILDMAKAAVDKAEGRA